MNPRQLIKIVILVSIYVLAHVLLTRNFVLFDVAFCYLYIGALLVLPHQINRIAVLVGSFVVGVIVDSFDNTLGMHAAATVLIAYLRPFFLQYQLSDKLDEALSFLSLKTLGLSLLLTYILPLIFVHHTVLFIVEAHSWQFVGHTLLKIAASTVFTTLLIAFSQLFIAK